MNEYNMRRKCEMLVLSCNTSLFKRSVINMGIWLYNKMPTEMWKILGILNKDQSFFYWIPLYSLNEIFIFEEHSRISN
jgi:hypothetical protein